MNGKSKTHTVFIHLSFVLFLSMCCRLHWSRLVVVVYLFSPEDVKGKTLDKSNNNACWLVQVYKKVVEGNICVDVDIVQNVCI